MRRQPLRSPPLLNSLRDPDHLHYNGFPNSVTVSWGLRRGGLTVAIVTQPPRWEPDTQMVAAVVSMPKVSRSMTELSDFDRAWLVAGLTLAGMTADEIAERTRCSRRLVMSIRAEDVTQAFKVAQVEAHELGNELRAERCQHAVTRRELSEACASIERLQVQVDQLVDAMQAGELHIFNCGHPMVPFNMYRNGGKTYCRKCRTDRQTKRRRELLAV